MTGYTRASVPAPALTVDGPNLNTESLVTALAHAWRPHSPGVETRAPGPVASHRRGSAAAGYHALRSSSLRTTRRNVSFPHAHFPGILQPIHSLLAEVPL